MTDDHEDYLPGEAPAAHKVSHQDDGTDEISVAGLSGVTESLAAHILLPTVHQDAPGLIETHRLVAGAHHAKYTDGDAVDAMGVLGDGNPLNHDRAAEWGAAEHTLIGDGAPHHAKYTNGEAVTAMGAKADVNPLHHDRAAEWGAAEHTAIGDAAPHHAKYTDAEARAAISPISIGPPLFQPRYDTYDWSLRSFSLQNRTVLTMQSFEAHLFFPNGITLTKVTLYGFRDDSSAYLSLYLFRVDRVGAQTEMAAVNALWTDGNNSAYDDSISFATINNNNYAYVLELEIYPNDSVDDIKFYGAKIDFTG